MKPEQLEIERLRREVNKLKAERGILNGPDRERLDLRGQTRRYRLIVQRNSGRSTVRRIALATRTSPVRLPSARKHPGHHGPDALEIRRGCTMKGRSDQGADRIRRGTRGRRELRPRMSGAEHSIRSIVVISTTPAGFSSLTGTKPSYQAFVFTEPT